MNGTARTMKLTLGSFALFIALTLAVVPIPQLGLRIQGASAVVETNDFADKGNFKKFCQTLGGTFSEGKYSTACELPGGHIYLCDETAKNCVFYAERPTTGPFKDGIRAGVVNGTLTVATAGGAGPTPTARVSRTANSSVQNTKDQ